MLNFPKILLPVPLSIKFVQKSMNLNNFCLKKNLDNTDKLFNNGRFSGLDMYFKTLTDKTRS